MICDLLDEDGYDLVAPTCPCDINVQLILNVYATIILSKLDQVGWTCSSNFRCALYLRQTFAILARFLVAPRQTTSTARVVVGVLRCW